MTPPPEFWRSVCDFIDGLPALVIVCVAMGVIGDMLYGLVMKGRK